MFCILIDLACWIKKHTKCLMSFSEEKQIQISCNWVDGLVDPSPMQYHKPYLVPGALLEYVLASCTRVKLYDSSYLETAKRACEHRSRCLLDSLSTTHALACAVRPQLSSLNSCTAAPISWTWSTEPNWPAGVAHRRVWIQCIGREKCKRFEYVLSLSPVSVLTKFFFLSLSSWTVLDAS